MNKETPNDQITSAVSAKRPFVERLVILRNKHGVEISEDAKNCGHYIAVGANCSCGDILMVAPTCFGADHKRGDPVMVCGDHGIHVFRFKDVVHGKQPAI